METSQPEPCANDKHNMNAERPFPELAMLSSVLNGFEHGASAMQQHVAQAMAAFKAGTYKVDAAAVSRLIIGECLGSRAHTEGHE